MIVRYTLEAVVRDDDEAREVLGWLCAAPIFEVARKALDHDGRVFGLESSIEVAKSLHEYVDK